MTTLYITFFAVMQLSEPDLSVTFYGGSLLVAVMPLCLMLLFGCYRAPNRTRSVFLIFMLLSGLSAFQYCFLVYLPVFLIGCAQMRILNARTLVAALLGCITPWWILFGFGVIGLQDIHLPSPGSLTARIDAGDIVSLVSVGLTVLLVILSYVLNVLKAIAYNAQSRAINGSFATLTLFTILAIFLDFNNIASYIPLLNFCAAIQLAHFFSVHRAEKSWIAIASIMAVYIVLFICQTVI